MTDSALMKRPPVGMGMGHDMVIKSLASVEWETPGLILGRMLSSVPEVRLVLERPDPDRPLITVLLEQDTEEALDKVFNAEQVLYATFPHWPFDLRVTRCPADWQQTLSPHGTVRRFQRP